MMKVFVSWSGERSKHIALSMKEWLPNVLQAVKPWMSDTDIESGQKWQKEIATQLQECRFGIICVTSENQGKSWLNFETGALSKAFESDAFVCPYLYEMELEHLRGPLAQFQSRKADKEGTKQLLSSINNRLEESKRLNQKQLDKAFEAWWKEFYETILACPKVEMTKQARGQDDILNEILENTRALRRATPDRMYNSSSLSPEQALEVLLKDAKGREEIGQRVNEILRALTAAIPHDRDRDRDRDPEYFDREQFDRFYE